MARSRIQSPTVKTVSWVSGGHLLSHFYLLSLPPLFPFLIAEFELRTTQLGILISTIYVLMIVLQPPLGSIVDRIGAKFVLVVGLIITGGAVAAAGFATGYLFLLLCALGIGIGESTYHPANYPLLDTAADDDIQGRIFAIHTFAGYIGFALAPVLVGGLAVLFDWRIALMSVGAVGVLYGLVVMITLDPIYRRKIRDARNSAEKQSLKDDLSILTSPRILTLFVFFIIIGMISTGIQTFTPLYVIEVFDYAESIGNSTLSVHMLLAAIGVLIGGMLDDRFNSKRVIVVTMVIAATVLAVTILDILPRSAILLITLFGLVGAFYGIILPSRDSLVNLYSPADATGRAFGITSTGISIGGVIAPALLGVIIDMQSISLAFAIICLCLFVGALLIAAIDTIHRLGTTALPAGSPNK